MENIGIGCLILLGIILVVGAIVALVVMLLWNWLVPELFNGPEISFWMAWGVMVLSGLLFKGTLKSKD